MLSPDEVVQLIQDAGGKVDGGGVLPDGSAFLIGSFPLPPDHWLYAPQEPPPMPFRLGTTGSMSLRFDDETRGPFERDWDYTRKDLAFQLTLAARYAFKATTNNGQILDLDPDALVQNFIVGVLGHATPDGWSHSDESANP